MIKRLIPLSLVVLAIGFLACISGCHQKTHIDAAKPQLTLLYNIEEESTEKSAIAQILQSQLGKAGIQVTLQPVANSVFYQHIGAGDYQAALGLWYLDYNDPEGFLTDFYSKAGFRMSGYQNGDYDKAYLSGLLAPTHDGKRLGFAHAQEILLQDLPWTPLYSNDELFLLGQGTSGFRSNAYQYYDYRRVEKPSLKVASNIELQTFDPALVYDLASKHVATQSYEGLVAMDSNLAIVPALAESWRFSPSGDLLSFTLRKGVHFHGNFGILNAGDVKASFERMLRSNSPYAYIFDYVVGIDDFRSGNAKHVSGFQVAGPLSFSIQLKQPFPTMLTWLLAPAAFILPAELPANYNFQKASAGTGPFVLKKWDGAVASLDANNAYWGRTADGRTLPIPKSLSIRTMKDVNSMLTAFQQGDLDILDVPLALYNEVLDENGKVRAKYAGYEFRETPLNNLKFIAFRMDKAPWGKDVELRREVSLAIDRDVIVKDLFRGHARTATNIIPSGMTNW
jgi:ABC-type transport system substrate-binding protein